jgi:uncharacterized protein (TIGR02594 family)
VLATTAASNGAPTGIGLRPDFIGPLPDLKLGRGKPLTTEEATAREIIAKAPKNSTPYEVARYFADLGDGKLGQELAIFASGWPDRWNPVIVTFFQATKTTPEGDETPWCAAFVNWCFFRANGRVATASASSGSFRCFSNEASVASEGDVVVFRKNDGPTPCLGEGHVGFVVRERKDTIDVLGGNQLESKNGCHKINVTTFVKKGSIQSLHSFRVATPQTLKGQ